MARRGQKTKEIEKNDDAPEFFNGCKFWKLMECQTTFKAFPQSCGLCDGCRLHKHESIVSRGLAEAQSAAATLFVTLTYADDAQGEYLEFNDVKLFLMRLRKDGFKVRKLSAGEYGSKHGRAHWHILLYFQWNEEHLNQWKLEQVEIDGRGEYLGQSWHEKRVKEWSQFCPKMRMGHIRNKLAFQNALADPESLWVQSMGYKNAGEYPQRWKYWPHGNVEARIVSAPNVATEQEQNKAVRYCVKYATKDPWKDGKLRQLPFDELPEHVKQATAYGPWDLEQTNERQKWVRGNPYVRELEKALLSEFESDDAVPLYRRIKRHKYNYKALGGLGRDYFQTLGAWYARNAGTQEHLISRSFKLGPSYQKPRMKYFNDGVNWKKHERAVGGAGASDLMAKRNRFYMGDTAFRQFAEGFNKYRSEQGEPETTGPDHIFDTLDSKAKRAIDISSGHLGLSVWETDSGNPKANKVRRRTLEAIWSELPEDRLAGLVPKRLQMMLEETSKMSGWQKKRLERRRTERRGKEKAVTSFGECRIIETTKRKFFFQKDLKTERGTVLWYEREIETLRQLELALQGKLAAPNARVAQLFRENEGDTRALTELDIRTVRKRIDAKNGADHT